MPQSIKLTYFDIEGVAECIRLALFLSGTEFEDERIPFSEWKDLKPKTPHGVLPLMTVDNGPVRTESKAMLRWVGATFSKDGKDLYPIKQLFDIEEAIGLVEDVLKSWENPIYIAMRPQKLGYPDGYNKTEEGAGKVKIMREAWINEELPKYIGFFTEMIDKAGGKWLVKGDNPTIADCLLVPTLRKYTRGFIDYVEPTCLDKYPKIVAYIKRFCALPEIQGRYSDGLH